MTPAKTSAELAAEFGLKPDEYARILQRLEREPTLVELGVFSVMWSEHCSYKSSRLHLRKFPITGPKVICGPGENAGVVDVGVGHERGDDVLRAARLPLADETMAEVAAV